MVRKRQVKWVASHETMSSAVDYQDLSLKLPAELRLQIYSRVFNDALNPREPLGREKCFPVPPIVRAWPELKMEIAAEWKKRLAVELTRLDDYQLAIEEADRKLGYSPAAQEEAAKLDEESERATLRQAQVNVLVNNCAVEMFGEPHARTTHKMYIALQSQGWPTWV